MTDWTLDRELSRSRAGRHDTLVEARRRLTTSASKSFARPVGLAQSSADPDRQVELVQLRHWPMTALRRTPVWGQHRVPPAFKSHRYARRPLHLQAAVGLLTQCAGVAR